MFDMKHKASVLAGVAIAVVAGVAYYVVLPRTNAPPPDVHNYMIFPGSVSRAIVKQKQAQGRRRRGGLQRSHLPQHLDFEAPGGAAVYVVRYPTGGPRREVEEMGRLTHQLKAGLPPQDSVAHGSGVRGRLLLNRLPYGEAKYLVLVRSEQGSEVTLLIHYSP